MIDTNVLIRADASPQIGGGHVVRTSSLGGALLGQEATVHFATRAESFETVPFLRDLNFEFIVLDCEIADEPEVLKQKVVWADVLVLDHYGRDLFYETRCRPLCRKLMVMDDMPNRAHDCDLLVDQTLGREAAEYTGLLSPEARVLTGPKYALLRPQFAQARNGGLAKMRTELSTILLMTGASDPLGLGQWVLEALASSEFALHLDVVSNDAELIQKWSEGCGESSVEFHRDVRDVASLMSRADLAIGASGSASWERCCLALPSLQFIVAENQRAISEALAKAGAALNLGDFPGASPSALLDALRTFRAQPESLAEVSRKAASICDGQGCERVAEEMLALLS